jgi:hypothetical protein
MDENQEKSLNAVVRLRDEHLTMARRHLHIGQSLDALRRFVAGVNSANKVYVLTCPLSPVLADGALASGQFVIRYVDAGPLYEIGQWAVRHNGTMDVSLGALDLSNESYDLVDRMLNMAWNEGVVTQATRFAKQVELG